MCECYFCNNNKNVIEPKCKFYHMDAIVQVVY